MAGLLDLADMETSVPIRGKQIAISGISVDGIIILLREYPDLQKLLGGRASSLTPEMLTKMAPGAMAAAIAAGTGVAGNKKAEAQAAKLSLGEQTQLLEAIFKATFPLGVGPFVESLDLLAGEAGFLNGTGGSGKAQDMKSQGQPKH